MVHQACAPGSVYCEIGCGIPRLGLQLARRGVAVVGVDFSPIALLLARRLFAEEGLPGTFALGDLHQLPLPDASIDVVYGGGVIEHFRDPEMVVGELHRVLRGGAVAFNTVPYLGLGSLTYRQVWGNIPDVPLLRPLAEFVHIKLLRARHMRFGYEKSFTERKIRRLFAGFESVAVDVCPVEPVFEYLPGRATRRAARWLARFRTFWPMIMVKAAK